MIGRVALSLRAASGHVRAVRTSTGRLGEAAFEAFVQAMDACSPSQGTLHSTSAFPFRFTIRLGKNMPRVLFRACTAVESSRR